MISLNRKQSGFTIVELLIVIVVIGILAALVITTFTGIQQRARNTERETDIKAIHGQLEAYYAQNGYYPTLAVVTASGGLPGLDPEALTPPGTGATQIDSAAATTLKYQYNPSPSGCDNTGTNECTGYTLEAALEGGGTYTKTALN
jgi:prepilin-type N-terminal cleavage/methylation domain-containing protein